MASYKVDWIRPTVYIDNAGMAVNGYQVRIIIQPWNEARDINVKDPSAETIKGAATAEVVRRAAIEELVEVEIELD